jgi:hypothetical protein
MQSLVYETSVETQHDLVARIALAVPFEEFSITLPGGAEHAKPGVRDSSGDTT